jgi:hypothetical protein
MNWQKFDPEILNNSSMYLFICYDKGLIINEFLGTYYQLTQEKAQYRFTHFVLLPNVSDI